MKKVTPVFLILLFLAFPAKVLAHCPLCVAGAGAGLSLSRLLGVDDSITGVWMAAFLGALSLWFANSLKKKIIPFQGLIIYITTFGLTIWSFYQFNLVSTHGQIATLDKLTFGMVTGGVIFYLVGEINKFVVLKRRKALFPYQGLVAILGSTAIYSLFVYILINYYI